jgi:L-fuconolactonase
MDIVDAQVHANMLGTEVTLAIMDALGVQGVLFDEYQRTDGDGAAQPGYRLADGTFRPIGPNAESAALRHPERFAFLMRVDPRDPGIEGWIETLATAPGFKALRTIVLTQADAAVFGDGGSDRLLKAARAHSLPLFVTCPGRMLLLEVCAKRFPTCSSSSTIAVRRAALDAEGDLPDSDRQFLDELARKLSAV